MKNKTGFSKILAWVLAIVMLVGAAPITARGDYENAPGAPPSTETAPGEDGPGTPPSTETAPGENGPGTPPSDDPTFDDPSSLESDLTDISYLTNTTDFNLSLMSASSSDFTPLSDPTVDITDLDNVAALQTAIQYAIDNLPPGGGTVKVTGTLSLNDNNNTRIIIPADVTVDWKAEYTNSATVRWQGTLSLPSQPLLAVEGGGKFHMTGGHLKATHPESYTTLHLLANTTFEMSGGHIYSENDAAIHVFPSSGGSNGSVHISGGTVESKEKGSNTTIAAIINSETTTTLSGTATILAPNVMGVSTGAGDADLRGRIIASGNVTVTAGQSTLYSSQMDISGGTYTSTGGAFPVIYAGNPAWNGKVNISGGAFNAGTSAESRGRIIVFAGSLLDINGGTFRNMHQTPAAPAFQITKGSLVFSGTADLGWNGEFSIMFTERHNAADDAALYLLGGQLNILDASIRENLQPYTSSNKYVYAFTKDENLLHQSIQAANRRFFDQATLTLTDSGAAYAYNPAQPQLSVTAALRSDFDLSAADVSVNNAPGAHGINANRRAVFSGANLNRNDISMTVEDARLNLASEVFTVPRFDTVPFGVNIIAADTTPPTPGNSGSITRASASPTSVRLQWTRATDDTTLQNNLRYYVYMSTANNISTWQNCEANGTALTPSGLSGTAASFNHDVPGLNINTPYYFNVVVVDASGNKAAYSPFMHQTISMPQLTGQARIDGEPMFGKPLTAVLNNPGSDPATTEPFGDYSYQWQWQYNVAQAPTIIPGATEATYIPTATVVDRHVSVVITAANRSGSVVSPSIRIEQALADPPPAPTLAARTATTITLDTIPGVTYRMDGRVGQSTPVFANLSPDTDYSFWAYYPRTATHASSDNGPAAVFRTQAAFEVTVTTEGLNNLKLRSPVNGAIIYTITGNGSFGTINPAHFAISGLPPGLSAGTAFQRDVKTVVVHVGGTPTAIQGGGYSISLPTEIPSSNFTAADAAGVLSERTLTFLVGRGEGAVAGIPELVSHSSQSVTVKSDIPVNPGDQTLQYAISETDNAPAPTDESAWQDEGSFRALKADTDYYLFARAKENALSEAGAPSASLHFTTPNDAIFVNDPNSVYQLTTMPEILDAIKGALTEPDVDTVTVTGRYTIPFSALSPLILSIPAKKKIVWEAHFTRESGTDENSMPVIQLEAPGGIDSGVLEITAGGAIISNTTLSHAAINVTGNHTLILNGGTIKANGGNAISAVGQATVIINDGLVETDATDTTNSAIYPAISLGGSAVLAIHGGEVKNNRSGGLAIQAVLPDNTVYVTGGTISNNGIGRTNSAAAYYIGNNAAKFSSSSNVFKLDDYTITPEDARTTPVTVTFPNAVRLDTGAQLTANTAAGTADPAAGTYTFSAPLLHYDTIVSVSGTLAGGRIPVSFETDRFDIIADPPRKGVHYTTSELKDGWTNPRIDAGNFTVTAMPGYQLRLFASDDPSDPSDIEDWTTSLTWTDETDLGTAEFFIKNDTLRYDPAPVSEEYKIDRTPPTAKVSYNESTFNNFSNQTALVSFFRDALSVEVLAEDSHGEAGAEGEGSTLAGSGVAKYEYHKAETAVSDPYTITESEWRTLTPTDGKQIFTFDGVGSMVFYVKVTDAVGNAAIFYERGAVFTDPEDQADGGIFTKYGDDADLDVSVAMHGNSVREIRRGGQTLAETDYLLDEDTITFTSAYLHTLPLGEAAFTVSYYPLGMSAPPRIGSDTIATTEINIEIDTLLFPSRFPAIRGEHYTISALDANGWTAGNFSVSAAAPYKLSLQDGATADWRDVLTWTAETADGEAQFYVRDATSLDISAQASESYRIDRTAPVVLVSYNGAAATAFSDRSNAVLFWRDAVEIAIEAADDGGSGLAGLFYHLATGSVANPAAIRNWTPWPTADGLALTKRGAFVLYVKADDHAGNSAIHHDAITVFSDAQASVDGGEFQKNSTEDLAVAYAMNGQTVRDISLDATPLVAGRDYLASENQISFRNAFLQTLAGGKARLNVRYYPLGMTATPREGSDVPGSTTITLGVWERPTAISISPAYAVLNHFEAGADVSLTIQVQPYNASPAGLIWNYDPDVFTATVETEETLTLRVKEGVEVADIVGRTFPIHAHIAHGNAVWRSYASLSVISAGGEPGDPEAPRARASVLTDSTVLNVAQTQGARIPFRIWDITAALGATQGPSIYANLGDIELWTNHGHQTKAARLDSFNARFIDNMTIEIHEADGKKARSAKGVTLVISQAGATDIVFENTLNISVTEKYPNVRIQADNHLNRFFSGHTTTFTATADGIPVSIEGINILTHADKVEPTADGAGLRLAEGVSANATVRTELLLSSPDWRRLNKNGNNEAGQTAFATNVRIVNTAPNPKLSQTKVLAEREKPFSLALSGDPEAVSHVNVSGEGAGAFSAQWRPDGSIEFFGAAAAASGKKEIDIHYKGGGYVTQRLDVSFVNAATRSSTLRINPARLSIHREYASGKIADIHLTPQIVTALFDDSTEGIDIRIPDKLAPYVDAALKDNVLTLERNGAAGPLPTGTHQIKLTPQGRYAGVKAATFRLGVTGKTGAALSLSARGRIDITNPLSAIAVTTRISGSASPIREEGGIHLSGAGAGLFLAERTGERTFSVSANPAALEADSAVRLIPGLRYELTAHISTENGEELSKTLRITPTQSVPRAAAHKKSVSLYRDIPTYGADISLTLSAPANATLGEVRIAAGDPDGIFELIRNGDNDFSLHFAGGATPSQLKSRYNLKLELWAAGTYTLDNEKKPAALRDENGRARTKPRVVTLRVRPD